MRFVVGLGNPGERYRRTRHNVGFMAVDVLLARAGAHARQQGEALVGRARLADQEALLVKPLTFMNRAGAAVDQLLSGHGGRAADVVVVVDDVALELGRLRVRARGSHGGHNGLRSIIETLGSEDFPRVRIGVKRGELPDELADYVLDVFPSEDVLVVQELVARAADAVESLIRDGTAATMNRFNAPPAP